MQDLSNSTAPTTPPPPPAPPGRRPPPAGPAVSPPVIHPEEFEEYSTFRETFLLLFTDARANAAMRSFGHVLYELEWSSMRSAMGRTDESRCVHHQGGRLAVREVEQVAEAEGFQSVGAWLAGAADAYLKLRAMAGIPLPRAYVPGGAAGRCRRSPPRPGVPFRVDRPRLQPGISSPLDLYRQH